MRPPGVSAVPERVQAPAQERDLALVRRAADGERPAFDALYASTVERVYSICLRLSGNRAEAERLTQDTYVRAWH